MSAAVLVVAKAPVPGQAKTRLARAIGAEAAARVAAAALLDTLEAVRRSGMRCVVAWSGDTREAVCAGDVREALRYCKVIAQQGGGLARRLVAAHRATADVLDGEPVLQIGMDTPQLSPRLLHGGANRLRDADAVFGPAADGGWWTVGVRDPAFVASLADVPMSQPDTGVRTHAALRASGAHTCVLPRLRDVDTLDDARAVARQCGKGSRFATAVETWCGPA